MTYLSSAKSYNTSQICYRSKIKFRENVAEPFCQMKIEHHENYNIKKFTWCASKSTIIILSTPFSLSSKTVLTNKLMSAYGQNPPPLSELQWWKPPPKLIAQPLRKASFPAIIEPAVWYLILKIKMFLYSQKFNLFLWKLNKLVYSKISFLISQYFSFLELHLLYTLLGIQIFYLKVVGIILSITKYCMVYIVGTMFKCKILIIII